MAVDGNSRFVTGAKVILPLAALGLLSTIFLFSGEVDTTQSIPYVELKVDDLIQDQRISEPHYASVTEAGTVIVLTASYSKPDPADPDRFLSEDIETTFTRDTGSTTVLRAPDALIDNKANSARISGGVEILGDATFRLDTDAITTDLETSELLTDGLISGEASFGTLEAGQLHILPETDIAGPQWVFQGGVNLVYQKSTTKDE